MPKLSIITPTYNSASTLLATLDSLTSLLNRCAEHIVVDSGSDDNTVEIAKHFGSKVIYHPPGNIYDAINAGLAIATGDWLTYINSDDILFADYVVEALDSSLHSADLIYGDIDYIDSVGRFLFSRRAASTNHLPWLMHFYNPFPQQGTLVKKSVFAKIGYFNSEYRYAADYDFFVRCILNGMHFEKFHKKSVAAFRLNPSQLSQKERHHMAPEGVRIRYLLNNSTRSYLRILLRGLSILYRWITNLDSIFIRFMRGRRQDSAWRN